MYQILNLRKKSQCLHVVKEPFCMLEVLGRLCCLKNTDLTTVPGMLGLPVKEIGADSTLVFKGQKHSSGTAYRLTVRIVTYPLP